MSLTPSTTPSSKLPFSNSVTGNGAVLLGPLASFHSGALRGRPAHIAEYHDAATTTTLITSCCCSSALSRATLIPSSCCVASPSFTPQPSSSVLAAFCPLTSEAWRSGTMRCGAVADADAASRDGSTSPEDCLHSPLVLSSDWSQHGSFVAARDTPLSPVSLSGKFLISTAPDANHADAADHKNSQNLGSEKCTVPRLSEPKAFTPLYPVQSPAPVTPRLPYSPLPEDTLSTPPNTTALQTEPPARDANTTSALSSCLTSEPFHQQSLLPSPVLHSLPLPFITPGLGCIAGTDVTQGRLSRHRTPVSAQLEQLARVGNEVKSRAGSGTSPWIPGVSPEKRKDDILARLFSSPVRRSSRDLPLNADEASCSPLVTTPNSGGPALFPIVHQGEKAAHRTASISVDSLAPLDDTPAEDNSAPAEVALTAVSSLEDFWSFSRTAQDNGSLEFPAPMATSPAPLDRVFALHALPAFTSEALETDNQCGEEMNGRSLFPPLAPERPHSVIMRRLSVEQHRNSVNGCADPFKSARGGSLHQRKRRFSVPQDRTVKMK